MNLRQFDLNLLLALDALLKEKNVTRAAERLFISQPAMSGMLARLRQTFGDELLVRVGRNLELTEFAAGIADRVQRCVLELEELVDSKPTFSPATENRSFSVAASDYAVLLLFGPLMQRLREAAPGVALHFVRLDVEAGERIAAGEIDFGILPAEFELPLPSIPLFDDGWVCAVWAGHPSIGNRLTLEEYLEHPHLSFNVSDPAHLSIADEYLSRHGHAHKIAASTGSFTAAPFLLHGTGLLALVPKRLGERMQEAADLRLLELPFDAPALCEKLAWNPRFTSSPGHAWMRELLVEVARSL
ncbi:MAG: LysR family transcriptional regulator [Gammaproteobacteria bacterium]|nr:LysR family transcriptional regulator [Gammaproteobacteria bacterium]